MYVSIRRYRVDPERLSEIVERVEEGFVPLVREIPGFTAYQILDCGDGFLASISVFDSVDAARQSKAVAADWVKENLGGFLSSVPDVMTGKLIFEAS